MKYQYLSIKLKDILKEINNIDDKTFMNIYQQLKNRAKKIEKKEKQAVIDNKFKKKGIYNLFLIVNPLNV